MKIKCIIVEDEPLALERIKEFVTRLPFLNLLYTTENAINALLFLKENQVDLIFLDINIGDISGIQLLETANTKAEVIIITAHHEFALKGFELNVTDYLLKPYNFERFYKAVEKVQNNLASNNQIESRNFVFIKTDYRFVKIRFSEIFYIEGMRDYRKIYTSSSPIMTLQPFKDFEKEILPQVICRVHKSFMVSIDKIESIQKNRIKIYNSLIPISETYKKTFFSIINNTSKMNS